MGFSSLLKRAGNATANRLADFGSGKTPHEAIDSPKIFNWIIAIGIVALGVGFWAVGRTIRTTGAPLAAKTNSNSSAVATLEALKSKDTDGDGLSDYDELFVYHSSPYLWSSAGDGVSDGEKVQRGLDPNCPINKSCTNTQNTNAVVGSNGQLTPSFLREALRQAGVAESVLSQLQDSDLLSIYNRVVAQTNTNTNAGTNTNANTNSTTNVNGPSIVSNGNTNTVIPSIANSNTSSSSSNSLLTNASVSDLNNFSASEIRQLLVQSGVDQSTLSQIDDATIIQIFQQAISNTNTNASS